MDILQTKKIKTRKPHQCLTCLRKFEAGTEMITQTIVNNRKIYVIWYCETCDQLTAEFEDSFLDNDNLFQEGCVCETMSGFGVDTPEELLELFNR
ncbi:MAG: hypothetical protein Q7J27_00500 [Syntrophales bacterium]|nr:hypothetical protein [Syntrophales bacterium]